VGPLRRMVSSDRYHCDQCEKGNPMRKDPNKGVEKGVGSTKKNCIKNDRYHENHVEERNPMGWVPNKCASKTTIRVYFFYSCEVMLRSEEYCSVERPKFLTKKMCSNFSSRLQEVL
jgi:hypothetical protein